MTTRHRGENSRHGSSAAVHPGRGAKNQESRRKARAAGVQLYVSSTPPARGATDDRPFPCAAPLFQSTPPRGGHSDLLPPPSSLDVSIHRPRAGATSRAANRTPIKTVSIHAPARGDPEHEHLRNIPVSIHAPARGALSAWLMNIGSLSVSIHAPAGGDEAVSAQPSTLLFQSTAPRVATANEIEYENTLKFQSTPPRGGRPSS